MLGNSNGKGNDNLPVMTICRLYASRLLPGDLPLPRPGVPRRSGAAAARYQARTGPVSTWTKSELG
jgi:hypothetical protein